MSYKIIISILFFLKASNLLAQHEIKHQQWEDKLNKGIEFCKAKDYDKAEKSLEKAYEIAQEIFFSYNKQFEKNIKYLTRTYWNLKKYDKMPPVLEWQIEEIKKIQGDDIKNYHYLFNDLGVVYKLLEDYEKAKLFQLAAFEYSKKFEGKQSNNYRLRLNNVFKLFYATKDFNKAIPLNIELLRLTEKESGKEHKTYIGYLDKLALSYFDSNDYNKARFAFKQLQDIYKKLNDTESKSYLFIISDLAICNIRLANYNEGLENHLETIELSKAIYGGNNEYYLKNLTYLGHFYRHFGKYAKAFETYENSIELIRQALGEENALYTQTIHKLGLLYIDLEDLSKARSLIDESVSLSEKIHSKNSYLYINRLNDLGVVLASLAEKYPSLNFYKTKAIKAYEEATELSEINDLKDHNYSTTLSNLGNLYHKLGSTNKALLYHLKAKEFNDNNAFPVDEVLLNNLAGVYSDLKEDSKALELYRKSLNITKEKYGVNHKQYKIGLSNLAIFYEEREQYNSAKPYIMEANSILIKEIEEIFKFRNEADKKEFIETIFYEFDSNQEFGFLADYQFDDINEMNLNNHLTLKGLLLNNSKKMISDLKSLNRDDVNLKLENLKNFKNKVNELLLLLGYGRKKEKRFSEYIEYRQQISNLEKDLIKIYNENFNNKELFYKNWKEIKVNLKPNEVAIEFSDFWNTNKNNKLEPDVTYIAYLISSAWEYPKVVTLFNRNEYLSKIKGGSPNQLYATRGSNSRNVKFDNLDLYKLIWKPLEAYIKDVETVYYSPYGILNTVSFAALVSSKNQRIIDRYKLIQLSSTMRLTQRLSEPKIKEVVLVGGADFEFDISNGKFVNFNTDFNKESQYKWSYLKGTKEEILTIEELFKVKNIATKIFLEKEAREEIIKEMDTKSPSVLHLATHGFYFPKDNTQTGNNKHNPYTGNSNRDDPLLRTGIVLTGANQVWRYNKVPKEVEDGTLSGLEISNLDLSNTDIVVLSACETGLGDIDGSEGVYGLQRAFKMAGVDIIVISLWEVPDVETAEFMNLFYTYWLDGKPVREAFRTTQLRMAETYKTSPEKWAAFVLFE